MKAIIECEDGVKSLYNISEKNLNKLKEKYGERLTVLN